MLGGLASESRFPADRRGVRHVALAIHTRIDLIDMLRSFNFRVPPYIVSSLARFRSMSSLTLPTIDLFAEVTADRVDCRIPKVSGEFEDRLEDSIEGSLWERLLRNTMSHSGIA